MGHGRGVTPVLVTLLIVIILALGVVGAVAYPHLRGGATIFTPEGTQLTREMASRARDLAGTAAQRAGELAGTAAQRAGELAGTAAQRAGGFAETAAQRAGSAVRSGLAQTGLTPAAGTPLGSDQQQAPGRLPESQARADQAWMDQARVDQARVDQVRADQARRDQATVAEDETPAAGVTRVRPGAIPGGAGQAGPGAGTVAPGASATPAGSASARYGSAPAGGTGPAHRPAEVDLRGTAPAAAPAGGYGNAPSGGTGQAHRPTELDLRAARERSAMSAPGSSGSVPPGTSSGSGTAPRQLSSPAATPAPGTAVTSGAGRDADGREKARPHHAWTEDWPQPVRRHPN